MKILHRKVVCRLSLPPVLVHELTHAFDFARAKARIFAERFRV